MENLSSLPLTIAIKPLYFQSHLPHFFNISIKPPNSPNPRKIHCFNFSSSSFHPLLRVFSWTRTHSTPTPGLQGVLSVRHDNDDSCVDKDCSFGNSTIESTAYLFPVGSVKHWLVQMDKPGVGVVSKAQMVDYYVQILTKVLRNEKDSQMCIYHVSWQSDFGFCCDLDDECAQELAGVPGVLSVRPDDNFNSDNKDYKGVNVWNQSDLVMSPESNQSTNVKTKKLFVTGLSFYTSEKTLRAAFEGFGDLVEVKIIMDKISKRSKGYAFVEYTTDKAASAALKEMNGKIINGWMIIVDVAKSSPTKYSRDRPRPTSV